MIDRVDVSLRKEEDNFISKDWSLNRQNQRIVFDPGLVGQFDFSRSAVFIKES